MVGRAWDLDSIDEEGSGETNSFDTLRFLTQTPVRLHILLWLEDSPGFTQPELRDRIDASRVTIHRNLAALEDRGMVQHLQNEYLLTPRGEYLTNVMRMAVRKIACLTAVEPFLRWFPDSERAFDIQSLSDATITVPDATNPYAPLIEFLAAIDRADQFRGILPAAGIPVFRVGRDVLCNPTPATELILSPTLETTLRTDSTARDAVQKLYAADDSDVFVATRECVYYLGLTPDTVLLGVVDSDGIPQATAETTNPAIREWAAETYVMYRSDATRLEL